LLDDEWQPGLFEDIGFGRVAGDGASATTLRFHMANLLGLCRVVPL